MCARLSYCTIIIILRSTKFNSVPRTPYICSATISKYNCGLEYYLKMMTSATANIAPLPFLGPFNMVVFLNHNIAGKFNNIITSLFRKRIIWRVSNITVDRIYCSVKRQTEADQN